MLEKENSEVKDFHQAFLDLIEIIHLTEEASARIYGEHVDSKILKIIGDVFMNSNTYSMSILLIEENKSELKIAQSSITANKSTIRQGEKAAGVKLKDYKIDINKSKIYSSVVKEGKTVQVYVRDIIYELYPRALAYLIAKLTDYQKKRTIITPLYRQEEIIGALAVSSPQFPEYYIPSVKNLAQHISTALELGREYSERIKAEQEREQLIKELEQKNRELESTNSELRETTIQLIQAEKLSALGELTANVAHELNHPLNNIKIICQSIIRSVKKKYFDLLKLEPDLHDVIGQVDKMADIINHMRIFTRLTKGTVLERVDLNRVLAEVLKFMGKLLKRNNIEIFNQINTGLPRIMGDPIRLEQVFLNIIINAWNALENTANEHKCIKIKATETKNHNYVSIEIVDNGGGIPETIKDKIFQPFFTTKESGKGTGLGLSIVKKIIDQHKGEIKVSTNQGEGTSFRILLPVAEKKILLT